MPAFRFLVFMLVLLPAFAQGAAPTGKPLPRVLILGDSVYAEPSRAVAAQLKDRAEVVFANPAPGEVRNSATALTHLDRLLGDQPWALIHVNFGLGDLVHRAPGMRSFRVMARKAGGIRTTPPKAYEANLTTLIQRLRKTGAILVWATTTPIRSTPKGLFELGTEIEYNAIASKVMAAHDVPVNDMYGYVKQRLDWNRPSGFADPFFFDRKPLHPPIVEVIEKHLQLPPPTSSASK